MHWARMFSSSSRSPDCLSTPVSMQLEQVLGLGAPGAPRAPLAMSRSTVSFMNALSPLVLAPGALAEPGLDRRAAGPGPAASSRTPHHRRDERVRGLAVEGVEAVVEAAERDRVQRQAGHVVRHVDLVVRVEPVPLLPSAARRGRASSGSSAHRRQAEGRQQDVVGPATVRVVGLGGEQARCRRRPDGADSPRPSVLSKRASSQSSSTRSKPETIRRDSPPGASRR